MKNKLEINEKLLNKNDKYLIAVSTGIDSMCLFDFLYKKGYNLSVLHVNHKRRVESENEYKYLKDYLSKINVPLFYYEINEKIDSNFQEEARKIRYKFFIDVAHKEGINNIITAHQADDLVETILYRLTRGTISEGYLGIKEFSTVDNINIIRPMLYTNRKSIEEYQKENNVIFFSDSSNGENHYTRNKIRHNVMPTLKEINSNIYDSIKNYQSDLSDLINLSYKLTNKFIKEKCELKENRISFKISDFNELDNAIKKEVLKFSINYVSKNTLELTHERLNKILSIDLNKSKTIELGKNIVFSNSVGFISIYIENTNSSNEMIIKDVNDFVYEKYLISFSQNSQVINDKFTYLLCYNKLDDEFPITLRKVKVGDKILLGKTNKKVFDLLMEERLEKDLRKDVIVFLNKNKEIFFVPGYARKNTDTNKNKKLYIMVKINETR